MRIWSINAKYLDSKGLVALWREALLAQNVLLGNTDGYKNHPQLIRFKNHLLPLNAISNYLHDICDEAEKRNYKFNRTKIFYHKTDIGSIKVTKGQINYEWKHFLGKVEKRDNRIFCKIKDLNIEEIKCNYLFFVVDGDIESWEII